MLKRMFDKHPYKDEVMTLHNLDVKRADCARALERKEVLSAGKINLIAIDICGMYKDLIHFIYLRRGEAEPLNIVISEQLLYLTRYLKKELRDEMLENITTIDKWQATELPMKNIETDRAEVEYHLEKLDLFYNLVDWVYLPKDK